MNKNKLKLNNFYRFPNKYFSTKKNLKFAVLLSGCGVYDGSEITESVSCMIALSKHNIKYQCYSVNKNQFDVVNHLNGEKLLEKRNTMTEAARIARGDIKDINELNSKDFDALVVPGGFGVAKNLSNFASENEKFTVDKQVENVLKDFYHNKKQIAACCIAPILLGKVFAISNGGPGATITLGNEGKNWPYSGTIKLIEKLGNILQPCDNNSVVIDQENNFVTTPAYMNSEASPFEIYRGIEKMIAETANRIRH